MRVTTARIASGLFAAAVLWLAGETAQAASFKYQGLFQEDDDVQLFDFTVGTGGGIVEIRNYGYGGGTMFDGVGNELLYGADQNTGTNRTDSTTKAALFSMPNYSTSAPDVVLMAGFSTATEDAFVIGAVPTNRSSPTSVDRKSVV